MLTMREIGPEGFSTKKNQEWNGPEMLDDGDPERLSLPNHAGTERLENAPDWYERSIIDYHRLLVWEYDRATAKEDSYWRRDCSSYWDITQEQKNDHRSENKTPHWPTFSHGEVRFWH